MCITSGVVRSVSADEELREMSRYGESLLYCNAALFDEFCRQCVGESAPFAPLQELTEYLRRAREDNEPSLVDATNSARLNPIMDRVKQNLRDQGIPLSILRLVLFLQMEAYERPNECPIDCEYV